jgi:hypothetical protein
VYYGALGCGAGWIGKFSESQGTVVEVEIRAESEGEVTSMEMEGGIDRSESRDLDIIV